VAYAGEMSWGFSLGGIVMARTREEKILEYRTREEEVLEDTKWKKYGEKECKAIFYLGRGWLRIDYVIENEIFHQQLIMDVYLDKKGNLEFR